MRVKARLTNTSIEQKSTPPPAWEENTDLVALSKLFTGDPLVTKDDTSWYLQATEIDDADANMDGSWRDVMDRLLDQVNGVAYVLRGGNNIQHTRYSYVVDDRLDAGNCARITGIWAFTTTYDDLEPSSAAALLALAKQEIWVQRVMELLAHVDRTWVWFDLWRVWDVMAGFFSHKNNFQTWVESLAPDIGDHFYDFQRSCNDPNLGDDRRHSLRSYPQKINPRTGAEGVPMRYGDAIIFLKAVVVRWIEKEFGLKLTTQYYS